MAYTEPGRRPSVDTRTVELMLVAATRSWVDDFEQALIEDQGEERGKELFRRYGEAFPTAYRADWVARSALADLRHIEELPDHGGLEISLYRPLEAAPGMLRAKLYRSGRPVALSDVLPLFENMGVQVADERPYAVRPRDAEGVWIYDFGLVRRGDTRPRRGRRARALPRGLHQDLARRGRGRRLQPARPRRRPVLAPGHGAARRRALPAPDRLDLQRPLRRAGARRPPGRRRRC